MKVKDMIRELEKTKPDNEIRFLGAGNYSNDKINIIIDDLGDVELSEGVK